MFAGMICAPGFCDEPFGGWTFRDPILSDEFQVQSVQDNTIEIVFRRESAKSVDFSKSEPSGVLIALPEHSEPEIQITEATFEDWEQGSSVASGTVTSVSLESEIRSLISITPLGIARYWRLGSLQVLSTRKSPLHPSNQGRVYPSIRFVLRYPTSLQGSEPGSEEEDGFLKHFRQVPLLDSMPLTALEIMPSQQKDSDLWKDSLDVLSDSPAIKIWTRQEGLVRIPTQTIEELWDDSVPMPAIFTLYHRGEKVPLFEQSGEQGGLHFWANKSDSVFSADCVYWLVADPVRDTTTPLIWEKVPSPDSISATPSMVHVVERLEQDKVFARDGFKDERQQQHWYWSQLNTQRAVEVPIAVEHIVSETFTLTFQLGTDVFGGPGYELAAPFWDDVQIWLDSEPIRLSQMQLHDAEFGRRYTFSGNTQNSLSPSREPSQVKLQLKPRTEPVGDHPRQPRRAGIYLDWLELSYARQLIMDGTMLLFQGSAADELPLPPDTQGDDLRGYRIRLGASHSVVPFVFQLDSKGQVHRIEPYFSEGVLCVPVRQDLKAQGGATYQIYLAAPEAFRSPQRMRWHQPAALRSPSNKADSLIITHEKFVESAQRLVDEQASKGRSVVIVNAEHIYDEFIDGATNPYAIRRFLTYALRYWQKPAPETVLFLGDASWDYWGRFPEPVPNYVPGYRVNPTYASDQWYVCVAGDDTIEDYFYGRIPLQEVNQVENALDKVIGYDRGEARGAWEAKALFFSDNEFEAGLEKVIEGQVPPYLSKEHIRLSDFDFVDNFYMTEVIMLQEKAKTSLKGTAYLVKKISEGCLIFEFFGHGSPNVLCHERIFFGGGSKFSDVKKLTNGGRLPFMLMMTCDTGHFDYAEPKWNLCIAEELLSANNGGVIGLFASTGRGCPPHHEIYLRALHECLFVRGIRSIGALSAIGKILFQTQDNAMDPIFMFQIFGDPMTSLRLPEVKGRLMVKPSQIQSRFGGRVLVSPETDISLDGEQYAFIADARGELIPEPKTLSHGAAELPVGFDVPADLPPGTCSATLFSASMASTQPATVLLGQFQSLPREPLHEEGLPPDAKPNLKIEPADITFSDFSPINGQTVFITVRVHNTGQRAAHNVEVRAYDGDPRTGGMQLSDDVQWPIREIALIRPGESETVRLRWDPFQNAGEHRIWVQVDPTNRIVEEDKADNLAMRPLVVRKKADLIVEGELLWNSERTRHELNYTIKNIGEETARKFQLQLKGYRSEEDLDPIVRDFDAIEAIAPGATRSGTGIGISSRFAKIDLIVDPDEIVDEETHTNNTLTLTVPSAQEQPEDDAAQQQIDEAVKGTNSP